jgi:S1-C subfamily serine protease
MLNTSVWDVTGIDYSLQNRDIAFLEIPTQVIAPVALGSYNSISVLDEIMHIGNPLNLNWTANKGSVSAIRQAGDVQGLDWVDADTNIIQHDISSDHGSSGGIILNESGEAVSILFAGFPNEVASGC